MSDAEEEVEGEEGEGEKKEEPPKAPKAPSEVQIKLADQAKYVAGKFDILFATTVKIEADITALHGTIKANQEALIKKFEEQFAKIQLRVETIEKECAEEKAAAEAARRAALGLPPVEPPDPMASFAVLHQNLGEIVKSKPELAEQAVKKLEETIASFGTPATTAEAPPAGEAPAAATEEAVPG